MARSGLTRSVRGKVITAVVLACCALVLAWSVSKIAFRQMLGAVQHNAAPSTPWRVAGELSAGVARLEGLERQDLRPIHLLIDTLREFYAGDSLRLAQVNTLGRLLAQRDKLVSDYLKVRADMLGDSSLSQQVRTLRERPEAAQKDSTVVTTERKSYTTTVYPGAEQPHEKAPRGFLRKLFGSKKKTAAEPGASPYQVVHEEMHTHVDTIATAPTDTTVRHIDAAMENLERNRRLRSAMFLDREAGLAAASDRLNSQIVLVLRQVEQDAVEKMEASNARAEQVVHTGITRINAIMFSFFLITAVLLYFILSDIARGNTYRQEIENARDLAEYHGKAKQRFLSNMSHEIRTPLQSIVGYSERIRAQGYAGKRDIDALHHSAEHLMQIVNEVLDYNRIVSGKFTFTHQVFSLPVLLDEVVSVMRLQADARGLALTTHFSFPEGLGLEGDPFRLKQVLYNLLGNAIKFTAAGWVDIAVGYDAPGVLVCTVTDTGPGIAPEDLERIFQEFEQAEDRHSVGGTGLGLPISKALIENQGGILNVSSVIGSGSVFTVSLPCARAASAAPALESTFPLADLSQRVTWILDDDPFILDVCSWMLSRHNVPHRCFPTPASLLNEPWDPAVGYLLLDIRMPGMNGLELCAALRPRIPSDVRIFALTAQVLPDEQAQVLAGGFDGLLLKPFTEESLLGLYASAAGAPAQPPAVPAPAAAGTLPELDLSAMERMTFGDAAQLTRMLRQFARDQREDKALLEGHLGNLDIDGVLLLVHRIAGRTGQVGGRRLAADFRRMEKMLTRSRALDAATIARLQDMGGQLDELIRLAEERAAGLGTPKTPIGA
ncbi:MAG TPA: ATP-binding protein [Dinghuibacter sp.]|uniref:hybrid sensor histidine kinase/response regulator n=1 Tax=Dinghuibacter sp. TaxID=2024697 RepID=UPI002CB9EFA4|nr:ATP-binding protein [Dinghuibacter sp.]HTJ13389.1 ATP-binding protein [Dinghuibacter sp.]